MASQLLRRYFKITGTHRAATISYPIAQAVMDCEAHDIRSALHSSSFVIGDFKPVAASLSIRIDIVTATTGHKHGRVVLAIRVDQLNAGRVKGALSSVAQIDAILVEMKQVLDKMLELETFNEVLDMLRRYDVEPLPETQAERSESR